MSTSHLPPECERFENAIAEELSTGLLEEAEASSMRAHAATCPECQALMATLSIIGHPPELPPADAARVTQRALEQLASQRRRRATMATFAAAAALLLVLGGTFLAQREAEVTPRLTVATGHATVEGESLLGEVPRDQTIVAGAQGVVLHRGDTAAIALAPGTEAVFGQRGSTTVGLKRGMVVSDVTPGTGGLEITTAQAIVRVKGTLFAVEGRGEETMVEVVHGVVEVETLGEPRSVVLVRDGMTFDSRTGAMEALSSARKSVLVSLLAGQKLPAAPTEITPKAAPPPDHDPAPSPPPSRLREVSPDTAPGSARREAPAQPRTSEARSSKATDLFAVADRCAAQRDWGCAATAYRELIARRDAGPEALTAKVALASIELEHEHDAQGALTHYEEYLRHAPGGTLVPDALFGRARCLRELGRTTEERVALQTLIEAYPLSLHAKRARVRLEQLPK